MSQISKPLCRIIAALDVDCSTEALQWVDRLGSQIDIFKVGLQLFSREGISVVKAIIGKGKRVFIDLKLHDIPNTVSHAAKALAIPGVEFLTIHASGGEEMMKAAVQALSERRAQDPSITTRLLAVTVLTSLDEDDLRQIGMSHSVAGQALNLSRLAKSAGVHGVVSSPFEVQLLRAEHSKDFVLVTPGVRQLKEDLQDQKRVMTPTEALQAGSDFLVMGRSLLEAPDPVKLLEEIVGT